MSRRTPDPTAVGIGLAFAGMLLLTLTPVAGRWAEVPPGLAATALGTAVGLMLVGAAVGLFGGREHSKSRGPDDEGSDASTRPPS